MGLFPKCGLPFLFNFLAPLAEKRGLCEDVLGSVAGGGTARGVGKKYNARIYVGVPLQQDTGTRDEIFLTFIPFKDRLYSQGTGQVYRQEILSSDRSTGGIAA